MNGNHFILASLVLFGAGCASSDDRVALTLPDGYVARVEVARTQDEQLAGLSGRTAREVGDGMLFCLGDPAFQSFWMLGMNVPIDMVWLYGNEVRGTDERVPLQEGNATARRVSPEPVDMVLELPEGWAERHGVVETSIINGAQEACKNTSV